MSARMVVGVVRVEGVRPAAGLAKVVMRE